MRNLSKMAFILFVLSLIAGCGDNAFRAESAHVVVEGKMKDGAKINTDEARLAVQLTLDRLENK